VTVVLHAVEVRHGDRVLVDVAEVAFEPGRAVTLIGESGSGKSLLAQAVMGTLPPGLTARGSLELDGTSYDLADGGNRRHLWGRSIALLPQEPVLALDPTMRVGHQVAEGSAVFARDRRAARQDAARYLGDLGLAAARRSYPHTLSGGMAQRVAFAAATIGRAAMLIADEPSKGLDERARADLTALLRRHLDGDRYLLTVTHDLDLARALGGHILIMKDAGLVERGQAATVLTAPDHAYSRRLLAAEPRNWACGWARPQAPTAALPRADTGTPLVAAENVTKSFGGNRLFENLSVTIRPGERVALTGPSGSGKTTLGNILSRLRRPDHGHVRHAAELSGGRLQKLYQDPALSFPVHARLRDALGDVLRRHRIPAANLDRLMSTVNLPGGLLERRPDQVSGGELQRLAVIRAMLMHPTLIFADEPTSRLDLVTQEQTVGALMDQAGRLGTALLLVTHDRSLAGAIADRTLDLGRSRHPAPAGLRRGADGEGL
jgi:peptide/nickel transport system ATP-binding protein